MEQKLKKKNKKKKLFVSPRKTPWGHGTAGLKGKERGGGGQGGGGGKGGGGTELFHGIRKVGLLKKKKRRGQTGSKPLGSENKAGAGPLHHKLGGGGDPFTNRGGGTTPDPRFSFPGGTKKRGQFSPYPFVAVSIGFRALELGKKAPGKSRPKALR